MSRTPSRPGRNPWDSGAPTSRAPAPGRTTSRAAVAAGLFACLCPMGLGGLLGIALGVVGLRQIAASGGALAGKAMAWLGIVLGISQLALGGLAYQRYREDLDQVPRAATTLLANVCAERPMEASQVMASGLRPAMDRGRGAELGRALTEALGEFQGLGERVSYSFRWEESAEAIEAEYALKFTKGAPATASLTLVRQDGEMRLRAFSVRSPALRKAIGAAATAGRELSDFQGPKAPSRALKEFRPSGK